MLGRNLIAGMDPGVSGGLIVLNINDGDIKFCVPFSKKEYKTWEQQQLTFKYVLPNIMYVFLEDIGIQPSGSKDGNISIAKLNRHYGFIHGVLLSIGFKYSTSLFTVTPSVWQTQMNCLTRGDKKVTRNKAKRLFKASEHLITHSTADAALIAEYGRRKIIRGLS